jgi:predicted nucleotide-binding protein
MSEEIVTMLTELVNSGKAIRGAYEYWEWEERAGNFIGSVFGIEYKTDFLKSNATEWTTDKGSQIGFLEGMTAKLVAGIPLDKTMSEALQVDSLSGRSEARMVSRHRIFIVHGHDNESKEKVARFCEKIGLVAVILHEQAAGGKTTIEKLEEHSDVAYAAVLLTPDDVGAPVDDPKSLQSRARQNVILELGYFVGKLGRARVVALHKEDVEIPSDFSGVVYVKLDEEGAWKVKLAQEFIKAGLEIKIEGLIQ